MAGPGFQIIENSKADAGLKYSRLAEKWLTWLYSSDPDGNNGMDGVWFYRGIDRETVDVYEDSATRDLHISKNQYVFGPVINAWVELTNHTNLTDSSQSGERDYVERLLQSGNNPPRAGQFQINDDSPISNEAFSRHLESSDFFSLNVPSDSKLNLGTEFPLDVGVHDNTIVQGYWVLVKFTEEGNYTLTSFARGGPRPNGSIYTTVSIYNILVSANPLISAVESLKLRTKEKILTKAGDGLKPQLLAKIGQDKEKEKYEKILSIVESLSADTIK